MPEIPERKVLKRMLLQLKGKIERSRGRYLDSVKRSTELLSKISEFRDKTKGTSDPTIKALDPFLSSTELIISSLLDSSLSIIEDSLLYTELLEHLASEYDKTLASIIKKAREVKYKARKMEPPEGIIA